MEVMSHAQSPGGHEGNEQGNLAKQGLAEWFLHTVRDRGPIGTHPHTDAQCVFLKDRLAT